MKKLLVAIITMLAMSHVAKLNAAVPPAVNYPTTAENSYIGDQVIVTIINHGSFSEEYRRGKKQVILSDNIIEAGHINGQYILALDASMYQDPSKTNMDFEGGLRLNLHSIMNRYVTLTPQWQAVLGNLEYYPRVGYDFGADRAHVWMATFNVGLGFGPGAGVPNTK